MNDTRSWRAARSSDLSVTGLREAEDRARFPVRSPVRRVAGSRAFVLSDIAIRFMPSRTNRFKVVLYRMMMDHVEKKGAS
ncbi:MAG: hypothetical protein NNA20_09440 [Nitrospira sp.]|nr:hypothetical protein [Nitrospira sp.]